MELSRNCSTKEAHNPVHDSVAATLAGYHIDTSLWGAGGAKTLEHLVREVETGETQLVPDGDILRRVIEIVGVDVLHQTADGTWLQLVERDQVFKDGRRRVRDLEQSLSEKLTPNEGHSEAVMRALHEELRIDDSGVSAVYDLGRKIVEQDSQSYPGLPTQVTNYRSAVVLTPEAYNPDGYQERQADKTTTWEWTILPTTNT